MKKGQSTYRSTPEINPRASPVPRQGNSAPTVHSDTKPDPGSSSSHRPAGSAPLFQTYDRPATGASTPPITSSHKATNATDQRPRHVRTSWSFRNQSTDDDDTCPLDITPLRVEGGGRPSAYLSTFFDQFNLTAVAADRMDAVFDAIPLEAQDRFNSDANFFFSNVPQQHQEMTKSSSMGLRSSERSQDGVNSHHHPQRVMSPSNRSLMESVRASQTSSAMNVAAVGGPVFGKGETLGGGAGTLGRRKSVHVGVVTPGTEMGVLYRRMSVVYHREIKEEEDGGGAVGGGRQRRTSQQATEPLMHPPQIKEQEVKEDEEAGTVEKPLEEDIAEKGFLEKVKFTAWWWWHRWILCDIYPLGTTVEERLTICELAFWFLACWF
ncbi:hypothetical protein HDU67_001936 [Dinochytrium kinnereticum]|nr:hypothetical protein HDU67_001936 [Dinochytrium kinnereticum]